MSEMSINNLSVDLLQDQASVALYKVRESHEPGKANRFTSINVNVPISSPGNQPENQLRRIAIQEAKRALEEAIRTLDKSPM